ncbi:MAG: DUF2892 domain-containing protein [Chlorobi bacterium]|nr:DUF2892 domain-containing protein [Chlorobiota bacterium]
MKANMSTADRWIRIAIAVLVAIGIATGTLTGGWAIGLGIVAVVLLLTSLVSFCPLYAVLGISTCRVKENQ